MPVQTDDREQRVKQAIQDGGIFQMPDVEQRKFFRATDQRFTAMPDHELDGFITKARDYSKTYKSSHYGPINRASLDAAAAQNMRYAERFDKPAPVEPPPGADKQKPIIGLPPSYGQEWKAMQDRDSASSSILPVGKLFESYAVDMPRDLSVAPMGSATKYYPGGVPLDTVDPNKFKPISETKGPEDMIRGTREGAIAVNAAYNTLKDTTQVGLNTVEGFATPMNAALLLGMAFLPEASIAKILIEVGFTGQMGYEGIKGLREARKKWSDPTGDPTANKTEAGKMAAQALIDLVMAAGAGKGAKENVGKLRERLETESNARAKNQADAQGSGGFSSKPRPETEEAARDSQHYRDLQRDMPGGVRDRLEAANQASLDAEHNRPTPARVTPGPVTPPPNVQMRTGGFTPEEQARVNDARFNVEGGKRAAAKTSAEEDAALQSSIEEFEKAESARQEELKKAQAAESITNAEKRATAVETAKKKFTEVRDDRFKEIGQMEREYAKRRGDDALAEIQHQAQGRGFGDEQYHKHLSDLLRETILADARTAKAPGRVELPELPPSTKERAPAPAEAESELEVPVELQAKPEPGPVEAPPAKKTARGGSKSARAGEPSPVEPPPVVETKPAQPETKPTVPETQSVNTHTAAPTTEAKPADGEWWKGKQEDDPNAAYGNETRILRTGGSYKARYVARNVFDIHPSHDAFSFAKNSEYGPLVNDRAYHLDKNAQNHVVHWSTPGNIDSAHFVNLSPDSNSGPPMTWRRRSLGGNGRTMMEQRMYREGNGDAIREDAIRRAHEFGLDPEKVAKIPNVGIERELIEDFDLDQAQRAITVLNDDLGKGMSATERAVSLGRKLSQESADKIGAAMAEMGDTPSLRGLMQKDPSLIRQIMLNDGMIDEKDLKTYFTDEGAMTDDGKNVMEKALMGSILPDVDLLSAVDPSIYNKIERILPHLIELSRRDDFWNMTEPVRQIVSASVRGMTLDDLFAQRNMFAPEVKEATKALAKLIKEEKPTALAERFKQFVALSRQDVPGQTVLFGKPDPIDSFNEAFSANVHKAITEGLSFADLEEVSAFLEASQPKPGTLEQWEPDPAMVDRLFDISKKLAAQGFNTPAKLQAKLSELLPGKVEAYFPALLDRIKREAQSGPREVPKEAGKPVSQGSPSAVAGPDAGKPAELPAAVDRPAEPSKPAAAETSREPARDSGRREPDADLQRGTGGLAGSGPGQPARASDNGRSQEERTIVLNPELIPAVDTSIVPKPSSYSLTGEQQRGAAVMISALEKHGGALLGDATGVGKTPQIAAISKYFADKGHSVLIVSPAEVFSFAGSPGKQRPTGSYATWLKEYKIDPTIFRGEEKTLEPGKVYLSTFHHIGDAPVDANTILIWDESQSLKNLRVSARAEKGKSLNQRAKAVLFASATPADRPQSIVYLDRMGITAGRGDQAYKDIGLIKRTDPKTQEKFWAVNPKVGMAHVWDNIDGLFTKLTKEGRMIRRELSWEGIPIGIERITLPREADEVRSAIEDELTDGLGLEGVSGKKKATVMGHIRRAEETFRVPKTLDLAKKELDAGRSVVIFFERINRSDVNKRIKTGPGEYVEQLVHTSPGTAELLRDGLKKLGVKEEEIAELHGNSEESKSDAMNRFQGNQARVVLATPASGGPQPYSAKVMTPSGWRLMGDLIVGDLVIAADGSHTRIAGIYEQGVKDVFRVTMVTGASTRCTADHLWKTSYDHDWKVTPLWKIMSSPRPGRFRFPVNKAVQFAHRQVPLDPYLLGSLLGDGSFRKDSPTFCTQSEAVAKDIQRRVVAAGGLFNYKLEDGLYTGAISGVPFKIGQRRITKKGWVIEKISGNTWKHVGLPSPEDIPCGNRNLFTTAIQSLGLWKVIGKDKFVPEVYLFNDYDVRLETLRGLMDTDGTAAHDGGNTSFCSKSYRLASDVAFLVRSLGGVASIKQKRDKCYYVNVGLSVCPFNDERKINRWRKHPHLRMKNNIRSITPDGTEQCRCLLLDHPDHLYVTDDFIVTHNTGINLDDVNGTHPRTVIVMTAPFGGDVNVQMLGRINRMTTKSKGKVIYLSSGTVMDTHNLRVVSRKMRTLKAVVTGGEIERMDPGAILQGAVSEPRTPQRVEPPSSSAAAKPQPVSAPAVKSAAPSPVTAPRAPATPETPWKKAPTVMSLPDRASADRAIQLMQDRNKAMEFRVVPYGDGFELEYRKKALFQDDWRKKFEEGMAENRSEWDRKMADFDAKDAASSLSMDKRLADLRKINGGKVVRGTDIREVPEVKALPSPVEPPPDDHAAAIKSAGGEFIGVQEGFGPVKPQIMFNDPQTKSTLTIPSDTPPGDIAKAVKAKIAESRALFQDDPARAKLLNVGRNILQQAKSEPEWTERMVKAMGERSRADLHSVWEELTGDKKVEPVRVSGSEAVTVDRLRQAYQEARKTGAAANIPEDHFEGFLVLAGARAARLGMSLDQYLQKYVARFEFGVDDVRGGLEQRPSRVQGPSLFGEPGPVQGPLSGFGPSSEVAKQESTLKTQPSQMGLSIPGMAETLADQQRIKEETLGQKLTAAQYAKKGSGSPEGRGLFNRPEEALFSPKGVISWGDDGRAIIRMAKAADVSTLVHEGFHLWRQDLEAEDLAIAEKWAGAKDGKWTRDAEENFARGGEKYLRDGVAPNEEMRTVFEKFAVWLRDIYRRLAGTPLAMTIPPEMRGVYDRMFAEKPGPVSMPELPERSGGAKSALSSTIHEIVERPKISREQMQTKGNMADIEKGIIAERAAVRDIKGKGLARRFEDAHKAFEKMPIDDQLEWNYWMDERETAGGYKGPIVPDTPENAKTRDALLDIRKEIDERWQLLKDMGLVRKDIEDRTSYWPRRYKQGGDWEGIEKWIGTQRSTRPLAPRPGSLKSRVLESMRSGVQELGLKPESYNPVDNGLVTIAEMDRFIAGQEMFKEMKDRGMAVRFTTPEEAAKYSAQTGVPWKPIDDKIAKVRFWSNAEQAWAERGEYYAPEEAADIMNNYVKQSMLNRPGAWGSLSRGIRTLNNLKAMASVSFSAFHALLGATVSSAQDYGMALQKGLDAARIAADDPKKATRIIAEAGGHALSASIPLASAVGDYRRGSIGIEDMLAAAGGEKEFTADQLNLLRGGTRAGVDTMYDQNFARRFTRATKEAMEKHDWKAAGTAAMYAIPAGMDLAGRPIMKHLIPKLKFGATMKLVGYEMEKLGPEATPEQIRTSLRRITDEVDNRYGQMVRDNMFFPRVLADSLALAFNYVDFNYGTIRTMFGDVVSAAREGNWRQTIGGDVERLAKEKELSHRLAYLVGYAMTTAMSSAILQTLMSGQAPGTTDTPLLDLVAPRTGGTNYDGSPKRILLPGYARSYYQWGKPVADVATGKPLDAFPDLWRAASGRLSGTVQLAQELATNKTPDGQQLRDKDAPLLTQMRQFFGNVVKDSLPISVRQGEKAYKEGEPAENIAGRVAGFSPPPVEMTRSAAEQFVMNKTGGGTAPGLTEEAFDKREESSTILQRLRNGAIKEGDVWAEVRQGKLSPKDAGAVLKKFRDRATPLDRASRLDTRDFLRAYDMATPREKDRLRGILARRNPTALWRNVPPQDREKIAARIREIMSQPSPVAPPPGAGPSPISLP